MSTSPKKKVTSPRKSPRKRTADDMVASRVVVSTSKGPAAIGPYSQAIVANGMAFISGMIGKLNSSSQLIKDIKDILNCTIYATLSDGSSREEARRWF